MDKQLDNSRVFSNLLKIADFFSGFEKKYDNGGYKQLTHDYEYSSSIKEYIYPVNRVRLDLLKYENIMPEELYNRIFGFLYGPNWEDESNQNVKQHCGSQKLLDWCDNNKDLHPIYDRCFFSSPITRFKHTIRVYDDTLSRYIDKNRFSKIEIDDNLTSFDAYCCVSQLLEVINSILAIINNSDKLKYGNTISITTFEDQNKYQDYRVISLIIDHLKSKSGRTIEKAKERMENGSGDLPTLRDKMRGYFLFSIEGTWLNGSFRWNILRDDETEEFEPIEEPTGFRFIIKVINKK